MELVQNNEDFISTVDTDGLVLWHQVLSSHIVDFIPMPKGANRNMCLECYELFTTLDTTGSNHNW